MKSKSTRRKKLVFLLFLMVGPSEEFFFEYPKKALMEFFQSLKAKKQPPKTNVQHYHVHYYPLPISFLAWTKAPDKRDLDKMYSDIVRSLGWTDHQYKYTPEPSIIVSSGLQQLWDDTDFWEQDLSELDEVEPSIDRNANGILVQVPVHQQLVFQLLKKARKQAT